MSFVAGFEAPGNRIRPLNSTRLVVGHMDFVIKGHKTQIWNWMLDNHHVEVTAGDKFGKSIFLILRGHAATIGEELAKAYGGAFGVGGVGSIMVSGLGAAGVPFPVDKSIQAMPFGTSDSKTGISAYADPILDEVGGRATEPGTGKAGKVKRGLDHVFGNSFTLRISSDSGMHSGVSHHTDGSVIELPSGLRMSMIAGGFKQLNWG